MSSSWAASISCLRSAKARTDGCTGGRTDGGARAEKFKIPPETRNHSRAAVTYGLGRKFPTFALEKEIRQRQALSWASSFSRIRASFLLNNKPDLKSTCRVLDCSQADYKHQLFILPGLSQSQVSAPAAAENKSY